MSTGTGDSPLAASPRPDILRSAQSSGRRDSSRRLRRLGCSPAPSAPSSKPACLRVSASNRGLPAREPRPADQGALEAAPPSDVRPAPARGEAGESVYQAQEQTSDLMDDLLAKGLSHDQAWELARGSGRSCRARRTNECRPSASTVARDTRTSCQAFSFCGTPRRTYVWSAS
jgi:hypothetical protein